MREEANNEIDLLLRRLSRRDGASAPNGDLRVDTDHLDADELSSYAENALPAAARARYTGHLAECSRCRELVVQLSSSAGVVVAEEPSRASEPSGLRKFLASLFSPMVLRYAVPAMALIVVALVGFAVFRSEQPRGTQVAMSPPNGTQRPVATEPAPQSGMLDRQEKAASTAATSEGRVNVNKQKEGEPPAPNATGSISADGDVTAAPAPVQKPESQPSAAYAAATPPASAEPKPTAQTADETRKQETEAQKQEEQNRFAKEPGERAYDKAKTENKKALAATPAAAANRAAAVKDSEVQGAGTTSNLKRREDAEKGDDAETRSVAGRRFRKQRGVWVDTAYNDGSTTNLTRDSEQFRALIADEPEIKTIADRLDGQIIVVWKGRAYRIR